MTLPDGCETCSNMLFSNYCLRRLLLSFLIKDVLESVQESPNQEHHNSPAAKKYHGAFWLWVRLRGILQGSYKHVKFSAFIEETSVFISNSRLFMVTATVVVCSCIVIDRVLNNLSPIVSVAWTIY